MKNLHLQSLFVLLTFLISNFTYTQDKETNKPKTFKQEVSEVEIAYYKSEAIKKIGEAITRAGMDETNRAAVSKTTQKILKYSKNMSKAQMQKFIVRLSKMSSSGLAALSEMSSPQINNFVADAAGKLSKNAGVLKQIVGRAGDKAGNAALLAISNIDDIIANNGRVPKALFAKIKDAASKLPPEKAKAYLDLLKKKFSEDWTDIVNLEDATKGPAQLIGKVVDGIFVLNDTYDIYYSDDEPELKAIKATGKMIDYGVSTAAGEAAFELGASQLGLGAGLGVGLTIAFTANRVSTLYTEIAMLEREKQDLKEREAYTRTNNRILMLRQFINVSNKIKAGQISNANSLLIKLEQFLLDHSSENEGKLFDLHKELEEKSKIAERNLLINEAINTARHPYQKAANFYKKGVELHLAKIYAAEALSILNNNLRTYPEIGELTAISKTQQLIGLIDKKIANAADFSITRVAAPERVYVGQSIDITVFVTGGIPYYSSVGEVTSNISDDSEVTVFWYASVVPGIEKFTITLKDCMGSIASTVVSIEVIENLEIELNLDDIQGIVDIDDKNTETELNSDSIDGIVDIEDNTETDNKDSNSGSWVLTETIVNQEIYVKHKCYNGSLSLSNGSFSYSREVIVGKCNNRKGDYGNLDAVGSWSQPPNILIPEKEYPMNCSVNRTSSRSDNTRSSAGIDIKMDYYDVDCGANRRSKIKIGKAIEVTWNKDSGTDSWSGTFKAPNFGYAESEETNKFQIKVSTTSGCVRYIYTWKK